MHYLHYNEKIQHGTPGFPVAYYDITPCHPRYSMTAHWHRETELLRVRRGAFLLYLEDRALRLNAGDLVLMGEAAIHSGEPEAGCEYECMVMDLQQLLSATEPGKRAAKELLSGSIFAGAEARDDRLNDAAESLFSMAGQGIPGRELGILGALHSVLAGLLSARAVRYAQHISGRMRTNQLRPVIEHIENNYARHITLDELARLAGLSPKYFCRYFQTVVHRTPIDYLNSFRIERACDALSDTDLSVAEIAYTCGFGDSSFFIKQFRRYKGCTPRQYRCMGGAQRSVDGK